MITPMPMIRACVIVRTHLYLATLVCLILLSTPALSAEKFVMAFNKDPEANSQYRFYRELYHTAFAKLGMSFEYVLCSSNLCTVLANSGEVDGEPQRIKAYGDRNRNLVRVNEPVFVNRTLFFSMKKALRLDGVDSLKNTKLFVDYVAGSAWSRQKLAPIVRKEYLTPVNSISESLDRLHSHSSDVLVALETHVFEQLSADYANYGDIVVVGVVGENHSFPYVHHSRSELAPKLANVLKEMKASGEYNKLLKSVMPYLQFESTAYYSFFLGGYQLSVSNLLAVPS